MIHYLIWKKKKKSFHKETLWELHDLASANNLSLIIIPSTKSFIDNNNIAHSSTLPRVCGQICYPNYE